jgi:microcystin-dependent protein
MARFLKVSLPIAAFALAAWYMLVPPPHKALAQFAAAGTFISTPSGGSANAQTIVVSNISSDADLVGVPITFLPGVANTGPVTLNAGFGTHNIKRMPSATVLGGGELQINIPITVMLNASNGSFLIMSAQDTTPVGTAIDIRGSVAPTGYLIEDGSCVSQTTYATLFAVINTTYGSCGGGLFALPDSRGTMFAALDNQGSNGAANRITSAGSGCAATSPTLCGAQNQTLTLAQLPGGITASGSNAINSSGSNNISVTFAGYVPYIPNNSVGSVPTVATGADKAPYATDGSSWSGVNGSNATANNISVSSTTTINVTSNNTGGLAHPILNPISLGLRAIKY